MYSFLLLLLTCTTFSENDIVFMPILSLCMTIRPMAAVCMGSPGGFSKLRKVMGGGDNVGGFNRLKLCQKTFRLLILSTLSKEVKAWFIKKCFNFRLLNSIILTEISFNPN